MLTWLLTFLTTKYVLLNYEYYSKRVMFLCQHMLRNSLRNCLLTEYCPHSVDVHSFKLVSGVVKYTGLLKISNYLDVSYTKTIKKMCFCTFTLWLFNKGVHLLLGFVIREYFTPSPV